MSTESVESLDVVRPNTPYLLRGTICGMMNLNPACSRLDLIRCRTALNWMAPNMTIVEYSAKASSIDVRCLW